MWQGLINLGNFGAILLVGTLSLGLLFVLAPFIAPLLVILFFCFRLSNRNVSYTVESEN
jgi:hypothetical protein